MKSNRIANPMPSVLLVTLSLAQFGRAQISPQQYDQLQERARGLVGEGRYAEALLAFQQMYQARPNPQILAAMVQAYLAQGQKTEAADAFAKLLAQGQGVAFAMRHNHGLGRYCVGSLYISPNIVRWTGKDEKDGFETTPSGLERAEHTETPNSREMRESIGSAMPELQVGADGKNWRFQYLLFGTGPNRNYRMQGGWIVYSGMELQMADKAMALMPLLLVAASRPARADTAAGTANPPGGSERQSNQIEIKICNGPRSSRSIFSRYFPAGFSDSFRRTVRPDRAGGIGYLAV